MKLAAVRAGAPEKGRVRFAHASGPAVTIVEDPAKHVGSRSISCSAIVLPVSHFFSCFSFDFLSFRRFKGLGTTST